MNDRDLQEGDYSKKDVPAPGLLMKAGITPSFTNVLDLILSLKNKRIDFVYCG